MTDIELFLELAQPDPITGISRWVSVAEFTGKYAPLSLGNGLSWGRSSSPLAREYNIEKDRSLTPGNRIDRIKLCGYKEEKTFSQSIRLDIRSEIKSRRCVICGASGTSENTTIEVDHKDGRKNDMRVSDVKTQRLDDFQPLCKACNDMKRQACKDCKKADGIRWDAKLIEGNPFSYYKGNAQYTPELGCEGCFLFDPVEYRRVAYSGRLSDDARRV